MTVGRRTREERAAEEEECEIVDKVRFRSPMVQLAGSLMLECEGRVATERADETEGRRCDNEARFRSVGDADAVDAGDVDTVWSDGSVRSAGDVPESVMTVSGARGAGFSG